MGADGRLHASFECPNTAAAFFEAAALLAAGLAVYARRRFLACGLAAGAAYTLSVAFVLSASPGRCSSFRPPWPLPWWGFRPGGACRRFSSSPAPRRSRPDRPGVHDKRRPGGRGRRPRRVRPPRPHAPRLLDMNWRTPNALQRLYYYRDAARMLLDRPWPGGGRAWEWLYHQYPSSRRPRRRRYHFLQTLIETGVPGLLASLSLWVALLRTGWTASRPADRPGAAGLPASPAVGAAWAIGFHSAMELDLSYLSMVLLVWALAGRVSGAAVPY